MKIQPTNNQSFNGIYKYTKLTSYGRCVHGENKSKSYDVYIAVNKATGNIENKLYYITKNNRWFKSILRLFSGNKVYKELRSQAK